MNCVSNCKFHRRCFVNTNHKFNFTEDIFVILDQKVNLVVILTSIKRSLTLFWKCSCIDLIFFSRHFRELAPKSQKHVLVKISSTKIYVIREREGRGRGSDSCHFSNQYFLPCLLRKHPTILFQNKNGIFQHKN